MQTEKTVAKFATIEHNSSAKLLLLWLCLHGPMPRAQLAQELHIGEATLKRSLKLLKELGYISESPKVVELTSKGDRIM